MCWFGGKSQLLLWRQTFTVLVSLSGLASRWWVVANKWASCIQTTGNLLVTKGTWCISVTDNTWLIAHWSGNVDFFPPREQKWPTGQWLAFKPEWVKSEWKMSWMSEVYLKLGMMSLTWTLFPTWLLVYSLIQPLPSPALFRPIDRGQTVHSAYNTQIKEADLYVP